MMVRATDYFAGLIPARLHPPTTARALVDRLQLRRTLDDRLPGCRLALVSAPPGYGKSTLLAQWRMQLAGAGIPGAWLSLDTEANDPLRCLAYLTAALSRLDAAVGTRVVAQLAAGGTASPRALAATLAHDLERLAGPFALFLDDFHFVIDREVLDLIDWLIAHCPPPMVFFIASRQRPEIVTSKLRLEGRLVEIDAGELSFDAGELQRFINDIARLGLGPEQLAMVAARTEGWIAGVQLVSLALRDCEDRAGFLAAFTGSDRDITDYLGEMVLARQTPPIRDFLLRTAVLERLCAGLCEAVTGVADSQRILEQIEADNLFLVPLDRDRRWFRYHHLFAEFLVTRLAAEAPREPARLCARASAWSAAHGYARDAIRYAFAGGAPERAAELIAGLARDLVLYHGEHTTLCNWVAALPPRALDEWPEIRFAFAFSLAFTRRFAAAHALLDLLDERHGGLAPWLADGARARPPDMQAMVEMLRCVLYALNDDAVRCGETSAAWLARWTGTADDYCVAAVSNALAYSTLSSCDFATGREASARAVALAERCDADYARSWAHATDGMLAMAQGRLDQALAIYQQALAFNAAALGPHSYTGSLLSILCAEALYEANDIEGARVHLADRLAFIDESASVEIGYAGYFTLARLHALDGEPERAAAVLRAGERKAVEYGLSRLALLLVAAQVRLMIARGLAGEARALAARQGLLRTPAAGPVRTGRDGAEEIAGLLRARLALAEGDGATALCELKSLMTSATARGRVRMLIELRVLKARALRAEGRERAAFGQLQAAIDLAAAGGFVRPLLDEDAVAVEMIRRVWVTSAGAGAATRAAAPAAFVARLQAACGHGGPAVEAVAVAPAAILTRREQQILKLLEAGSSNRELAETLFVSEQTVKWHLRRMYRKLGVKNRTSAIARARQAAFL